MLLYNVGKAVAQVGQCSPMPNGLVLNKYYLEDCAACKRISPVINEIKEKLEKADIPVKFREVECTECECEGITSFPTIEITQDKESKNKSVGYKDYSHLSEWIAQSLGVDKSLFEKHIDHESGEVKTLIARDFLGGFEGQWLILFYSNHNDPLRKIFKKLAMIFKDKLSIGEVYSKEAQYVTNRFNISEYPHISAINHGISVPFARDRTLDELSKFADRLYRPAFESLSYSSLKQKSKHLKPGEPIYVVLYKDFEVASHYFNDIAQQFKFKAVIYKSNDPAMFEASGFYPHDKHELKDDIDHNKMVHLLVYKNGSFYPCPVQLENSGEIVQWIFHTHFAHVTNINNENFYTIFHGIKPVAILLTSGELFVEEFNKLSAERHLGSPYTNMIFATLDTSEYPVFKKQILDKTKTPSIAFYDPISVQWYYEERKLTRQNFYEVSMGLIEKYFAGKLDTYPTKKRRYSVYMIMALAIAIVAVIFKASRSPTKED